MTTQMRSTSWWQRWQLLLMIAVVAVFNATATLADERILLFHSDIGIAVDGSMQVTETIRVRAEGDNIRRGIYREFPTRYRDSLGNAYNVEFEVLDVTRDGSPEPWNANRRANGVRVDLGDDSFLPVPADYEYTITYRTNRQVGFFKMHDELYWNVTGLGWNFVIDQASATVNLPQAVPAADLMMEGYTGPLRGRGQDYSANVDAGTGTIRTTKPLPPNQGLTLVLSWPKDIVREPTQIDRTRDVLSDNRGVLLALLTLMGTGFYLGSAWSRVGRDPEPGVIFPHYTPPDGCSPATASYVSRMGYRGEALSAALVDLAVLGYLHITQQSNQYQLQRRAGTVTLPADEQALCDGLFAEGDSVALINTNHARVATARSAHAVVLKQGSHGVHFLSNGRYLLWSLLASLAMLACIIVMGAVVPLVIVTFGVIALLHLVFAWLLKAPTATGRQLLDELEGFKLYLEVAEKDEMDLRNPPQLTPELFERYLPYAIALGVEQRWGERFARALAAMQQERPARYHPLWYSGSFNTAHIGDFTRSVGNGFQAAIASAATPPGSSSGSGGGGFSGGGGGGGGGGGR